MTDLLVRWGNGGMGDLEWGGGGVEGNRSNGGNDFEIWGLIPIYRLCHGFIQTLSFFFSFFHVNLSFCDWRSWNKVC